MASEDEKESANKFALNLVAAGLDEKPTPDSQNYGPDATFNTYDDALDAWQKNLTLLICAEFGIVKDHGEEFIPADLTEWEAFYEDAKEYDDKVNPKKSGGSEGEGDETSIEDHDAPNEIEPDESSVENDPALSSASYALYVKLLRNIAVYNFVQNSNIILLLL